MAGAAQCDKDEQDIADLTSPVTKVHKKKRKKKTQTERRDGGSETEECIVTLSDAEEELKQMKLSDGSTIKSVSKRKKKKKERRDVEGGESSPLKDLQCNASMADDRQTDSAETKAETKPNKKKKKKKKHLDDDHGSTAMAEPECDNCLDVDAIDQSNKEEVDNGKMSDSQSQLSREEEEEESCLQEDAEETVTNGDDKIDVEPLLMPLVHEGKSMAVTKEKKQSVRRQLPQWIVEADIFPDDIIEKSR